MDDDSRVIDKGWDALPDYESKSGDADDAVTVSISTTPGEWLVNTQDAVVVPMSMADVVDALRARKLTERSLVWRAGMQEWAPIDKVPSLKLAARMAPSAPPPAASVAPAAPSTPPPSLGRPASKSPPPRPSSPAPQQLSRRSTLPFGLPVPNPASRPSQPKLAAQIAAREPSQSGVSEPGVLAVYDRPAATISFDLSPSEPARVPPPVRPAQPPETLAPTTSDQAAPQRPAPRPAPANSDLSVVAAYQFREVKRSAKRLIVTCSIVSAAAASLLTLWASGKSPFSSGPLASAPAKAAAAIAAAPAPVTPVVTPAAAPAPAAAPTPAVATGAVEPSEPTVKETVAAQSPKPAAARPLPKSAARKSKAGAALARGDSGATRVPGAEPNPYDVQLTDEAPTASNGAVDKPGEEKAARPPLNLEEQIKAVEGSSASTSSPGF